MDQILAAARPGAPGPPAAAPLLAVPTPARAHTKTRSEAACSRKGISVAAASGHLCMEPAGTTQPTSALSACYMHISSRKTVHLVLHLHQQLLQHFLLRHACQQRGSLPRRQLLQPRQQ